MCGGLPPRSEGPQGGFFEVWMEPGGAGHGTRSPTGPAAWGRTHLSKALHRAHQEDEILHQVRNPHPKLPKIVRLLGDTLLEGGTESRGVKTTPGGPWATPAHEQKSHFRTETHPCSPLPRQRGWEGILGGKRRCQAADLITLSPLPAILSVAAPPGGPRSPPRGAFPPLRGPSRAGSAWPARGAGAGCRL